MHRHNHTHAENVRGKKLLWVTLLNFSISLVQVAGGIISNSLSLISDAIHNLGDTSAIFIAFLAGKHADKRPDARKTFGYKRTEILAALFNAVVLIAICFFLFVEAYERFRNPQTIKGGIMLSVAVFGLIANLISVLVLQKEKSYNLNIRAAYLHLLGDTLSSVAVIAGGIAILVWQIYWLDPLVTVAVGVYIIYHTWDVVRQTVDILMQATPRHIDIQEIKQSVEALPQVENIHHLHIWQMDDEHIHLEAHLNISQDLSLSKAQTVRHDVETLLKDKFGISHITLQIEYKGCKDNDDLIVNRSNSRVLHRY
ncbi:MAG: cation diffusion facilitator family transporter [Bacteroidaceae bacterium]|jgi:cobalt-zinc-cadmium efflux system protein|nr:cation transporter [Bacteroidaceae bacterium]MBP8602812.1 cation transporter [Bacteroidaceae bacterium]HPB03453.1 cation diffusion facilitator family transporter [Bacteroidaceae bacterium]HUM89060.1 cation diffusion facilitator family transporter [Prolixibacteraceae bacterium]